MYETPGTDVVEITVNSAAVNKKQPLQYVYRSSADNDVKMLEEPKVDRTQVESVEKIDRA